MKTVFFEVSKKEQAIFTKLLPGDANNEVLYFEEKLSKQNAEKIKDAEIVSVFVNSLYNREIADLLPNLKFISARSTGFDNIDCEYAKSRNIKISNIPAYGSNTVAEFAFALLLTLSRKIYDSHNYLKEGNALKVLPAFEGFDLFGKSIGIVGTGKIGKNVVRIAKGFGMNVLAYDLYPDQAFAAENNFRYQSFDEVIAHSDILTLHAPYTKDNHHLINKENISKMKKGVYIINTARGELIDTDALILGLKEGVISGAGLDVLEGERELKEAKTLSESDLSEKIKNSETFSRYHALINMSNVILTPHIAFCSKEAIANIINTTVENIKSFIDGKPINLVQ